MGNLNAVSQGDLALARVTNAAGASSFGMNRGFASVTHTAAGVYTLVLDQAQDLDSAAVVTVTPVSATFAALTVSVTNTTTLVVRSWDAAAMALDDIPFWIRITPVAPA